MALTSLAGPAQATGQESGVVSEEPESELVPADDPDLPIGELSYEDDSDFGTAAWSCVVYASDPRRIPQYYIEGASFQSCSGTGWPMQRIAISIQRKRWYGWQTLDTEYTNYTTASWIDKTIYYNCYGTGTWTYRVLATGYAQNGARAQSVQSQNYLRTYC